MKTGDGLAFQDANLRRELHKTTIEHPTKGNYRRIVILKKKTLRKKM